MHMIRQWLQSISLEQLIQGTLAAKIVILILDFSVLIHFFDEKAEESKQKE